MFVIDSTGNNNLIGNQGEGLLSTKFSIVMANYNNAKWIGEAIESVLKQTFRDLELIIVDDCSTDNSLEVIKPYLQDKRIRLIKHEQNRGFTGSLITGINNVKSEFFGQLDSDDVLLPKAVEMMYNEHVKHPDCGLIYSLLVDCDENLNHNDFGFSDHIPDGLTSLDADVVSGFKTFKLNDYKKTEGYDPFYVYAQDKDIIYKMEEVCKLKFVPDVLYLCRHLASSQNNNPEKKCMASEAMEVARIAAYRRRLKMPAFDKKYKVSVVIPAYNKPRNLAHVLNGFANQTVSKDDYEVIVVDDGSAEFLNRVFRCFNDKINIIGLRQPHGGFGVARNLGVELARGDIILFNDDCNVPCPNLIEETLRSHQQYPDENVAVLGNLQWHADLKVSPVMYYVSQCEGEGFGFAAVQDGQFYDAWKWWSGLMSARRSLLTSMDGPFDASLNMGGEDAELVCRLLSRDVKILHNSKAERYILRCIDFKEFVRLRYAQGKALCCVAEKHPDIIIPHYGLDNAEHIFNEKLSRLKEWKAEVKDVESQFARSLNLPDEEKTSLLHKLCDLYRVCFMGEWLRGYIEKKNTVAKQKVCSTERVNPETTVNTSSNDSNIDYNAPVISKSSAVKKIVFINSVMPGYDLESSNLRVYELIKILEANDYEIDYLYFGECADDEHYKSHFGLNVKFIKVDPCGEAFIKYFRNQRPDEISHVWATDLCVVGYLVFIRHLIDWLGEHFPLTRVLIDTRNCHYKEYKCKYEVSKYRDDLDAAEKFFDVEKELYPLAHNTIVVTESERKDILREIDSQCDINVIPNIHRIAADIVPRENRKHICFLGSIEIDHNRDAVLWFINKVWPIIVEQRPDMEFHILGYKNEMYREQFEVYKNVKVVGYIEDADAAISQYNILVCPILYGAGMRGKIGTAVANGTPIVTTSIGVEGFELVDGENCFIADSENDFAQKCIRLYEDSELWNQFSKSAYKIICDNYSVRTVSNAINKLFSFDHKMQDIRKTVCLRREKKMQVKVCHKPKVTIITSCYNCKDYLYECVESIRAQTLTDWELFLIDDASTDGTADIIREYSKYDTRIQGHCFKDNKGPYIRRNFAIKNAKSDFIVVQDSDDIMATNKLEAFYDEMMSDEKLGVVGSYYCIFMDEFKSREFCDELMFPIDHESIASCLYYWHHTMSLGSCMIRKSLFDLIGNFDGNRIAADRFWFSKLGLYMHYTHDIKTSNVPESLSYIRIHDTAQTQQNSIYDPRDKRKWYKVYCKNTLKKIEGRYQAGNVKDLAEELRMCDCSDFTSKFAAKIDQCKIEAPDEDLRNKLMGRAVFFFNLEKYVSCLDNMNNIEKMFPDVADNYMNFSFLKAMVYFSLDLRQKGMERITRELQTFNNPGARKFIGDYISNRIKGTIFDWCANNSDKFELEFIYMGHHVKTEMEYLSV